MNKNVRFIDSIYTFIDSIYTFIIYDKKRNAKASMNKYFTKMVLVHQATDILMAQVPRP